MNDRQLPRDDEELQQHTGISPADHPFTAADPSMIEAMERRILGPDWYRRRKRPEEVEK